jgi:hypothetical protein
MDKKMAKIMVFVLAFCTSTVGLAQMKGAVEDSVKAKHQNFKACFENLDKKFKSKLKETHVSTTFFKQVANTPQFLLEKKKISKIFNSKGGSKHGLADTYNKLAEMVKKEKIEINVDYVVTGSPTLVKAKNKRYCTYKTTAALKVEAKTYSQTSNVKNELTLLWTVEMKDVKGKVTIKTTQLTSIKAKPVSNFFEYEKQQMQEIAKILIEEYYRNLQLKKWDIVLKPEIPDKENVKVQLMNSKNIDILGNVQVLLPNSQTIIVSEDQVPFVNLYSSVGEQKQVFALTFYIKINDNLKEGKITKVEYRLKTQETTPVPEPPVKEIKKNESEIKNEVGLTYKVQILALYEPVKLSDLPKEYSNIENVVMEESLIDGKTYYQYVIPVGNNMKDAQSLKKELIGKGINVWIVKYKDGKRIIYPAKK